MVKSPTSCSCQPLGDNLKKTTMRIRSFYDKIGLSSLGAGLDGLFIHSDLTSWMDKLAPYLLLIIIKRFISFRHNDKKLTRYRIARKLLRFLI